MCIFSFGSQKWQFWWFKETKVSYKWKRCFCEVFIHSLSHAHMHIPSTLLLLHFLCVYLPFRFHSRLLPCLGINNITICCNKIQVTCLLLLLLVICDRFWWWCTNDGAYNSNACIVIAHDLIRHLSLPFLTKFSWSFSYVIKWLFILFMHWNKGQLNFIKSKGKTYMKFLYEERFFQFKVCCFFFSLMSSRYFVNI
jgi:hypothetical protein